MLQLSPPARAVMFAFGMTCTLKPSSIPFTLPLLRGNGQSHSSACLQAPGLTKAPNNANLTNGHALPRDAYSCLLMHLQKPGSRNGSHSPALRLLASCA